MSTPATPAPQHRSFFGKIGHFFASVGKGIAHGFEKLFGSKVAHDFAHAAAELLKSKLGTIVLDAVDAVESLSPTLGSEEKRKAAFSKILSDATAAGISTSTSIVNMLIEIAVNMLKGKITDVPAEAPTA